MQALGWGGLYGCGLWRGVGRLWGALGLVNIGEVGSSLRLRLTLADVLLETCLASGFILETVAVSLVPISTGNLWRTFGDRKSVSVFVKR